MAVKKEETTEVSTNKDAGLKAALSEIQKQFGKEAIISFTDNSARKELEYVSSGSLSLDLALGGKGYPKGRIVELFSEPSCGKTTICLHAVAEVQKQGGKAAYFDLENALDLEYAAKLGVKVDELIFSQPDSGEQALEMANILMKNNAVDIVVFDSVAAMIPRAELEGNIGDNFIGTTARLLSQGLKKIAQSAARANCLVMFVNQTRNKIGVMYGSPLTTSGGEALKFYATQRLHITRTTKPLEERGEAVGNETKVKVVKNKVAPPFRIAEFVIEYNKGISIDSEVFKLGVKLNLIEKAGSFYSYEPEQFRCQGEAKFKQWLHENPEIKEKIIAKIKESIASGDAEDIVEAEDTGVEE